jgi:hypothetical protein
VLIDGVRFHLFRFVVPFGGIEALAKIMTSVLRLRRNSQSSLRRYPVMPKIIQIARLYPKQFGLADDRGIIQIVTDHACKEIDNAIGFFNPS